MSGDQTGRAGGRPLAQLLTNQVLIEMAIQELVTVPVVNVNLTQPIRMTTRTSRAYATGLPEDNRWVPFRHVEGTRHPLTHSIKFHLAQNMGTMRQDSKQAESERKLELTVDSSARGRVKNISSRSPLGRFVIVLGSRFHLKGCRNCD